MSAPPFPMRHILHRKAHKFLYFALFSSIASGAGWFFFYTVPRFRKYERYFETYDPYERAREICSYPVKYLHSCPSELMKKAEEKGITIGTLDHLNENLKIKEPIVQAEIVSAVEVAEVAEEASV